MDLGLREAADGAADGAGPAYGHEAVFYDDRQDFVREVGGFVAAGLEAGDAVLVALPPASTEILRAALGSAAGDVQWADMTRIGKNPAVLVAAWCDFIERNQRHGRRLRGVGEPAYPQRNPDELTECLHHEALLNVAIDPDAPLTLLCPYDASGLPRSALDAAASTHPYLLCGGAPQQNGRFAGDDPVRAVLHDPLPPAPSHCDELVFSADLLHEVREATQRRALECGLSRQRTEELVVAINELASNSVRHGGGAGVLRAWCQGDRTVHEISDAGRITDPLTGRRCPPADRTTGRGLWMTNRLCDLVQLRSDERGTTVRVHMELG